jgi:nucleotide-binding universal stress UspA family protein
MTCWSSMDSFERILVGTDGSAHAEVAVTRAVALAKLLSKPLVAIYVVDPVSFRAMPPESFLADMSSILRKEANDILAGIKNRGKAEGLVVETVVREGRPAEELCAAATAKDLIVVATHGRRGLGRILLGSVAENVVRHAPCPVLVIRDTTRGQ